MPLPVIPIKPPYLPELLPEAAEYIRRLGPVNVFEFGSGHSTLWFLEFALYVVTVEHEEKWAQEVKRALRDASPLYPNLVDIVLVDGPEGIPSAIDYYGTFDMVFVDCHAMQRKAAIERSAEHVRPGGYMVVDDSHWGGVHAAVTELEAAGWQREDISGMHTRKTGAVRFHQTSILRRPDGQL